MSSQPTFETNVLDMISVNGRISKKLFEKIVAPKLNQINKLQSIIALQDEMIKNLREAVEFYGDKFSWCCRNDSPNAYRILPHDRSETTKAKLTGGRLARQTLKEVDEIMGVKKC